MDIRSGATTCGEGCIPEEGAVVWEGYMKGPPAVEGRKDKVHIPLYRVDVKTGFSQFLSPVRGKGSELDVE
jgi:hypothetical protein